VQIEFDAQTADGVVYAARPGNPAFLGPAPPEKMAQQINRCVGPSGSNRDYMINLARALRELGADDPHVFELEQLVLLN
jgi:glutathione-specific gamma-glutamylcyclotransferase